MKTNKLYTIPLMLASSVAFPIGMGEIRVESFINQPFRAEIPLLDVGSNQLSAIKVSLASPDEYERIGLELEESLPFLKFEVSKNERGQAVIKVSSLDRITEPYMRILVDLAWPKGEIYRTYTVLLDPPGYKLSGVNNDVTQHHGRVSSFQKSAYVEAASKPALPEYQAKAIVYGPTQVNENIWQISQSYLSSGATLQQIILAIVGTNSQAFTQGNLNGLKIGERLRIPSKEEVLDVPVELARQEVDAHDLAWKSRQEIKHVLLPPYVDGVVGVSQFNSADDGDNETFTSIIPQAPQFENHTQELPVAFSGVPLIPASSFQSERDTAIVISYVPSVADIRANLVKSPTVLADNTESATLKKQLQDLQVKNNQLEKALVQQNKDIKSTDLNKNTTDKSQHLQISQTKNKGQVPENSSWSWLYLLLIAGLTGGGAYVYNMRSKPSEDMDSEHQMFKSMIELPSIGEHEKIPPETPNDIAGESSETSDIGTLSQDNTREDIIHASNESIDNILQEHPEQVPEGDDNLQEEDDTLQEENDILQEEDDKLEKEDGMLQEENHKLQKEDEKQEPAQDIMLEFEEGLDKLISKDTSSAISPVTKPETEDNSLEYFIDAEDSSDVSLTDEEIQNSLGGIQDLPDEQEEQEEELVFEAEPDLLNDAEQADLATDNQEDNLSSELNLENAAPKLIKSKAALDTLLALAKTYISMEDYESARQSLNELLMFGDDNQKQEAQTLIDQIAGDS